MPERSPPLAFRCMSSNAPLTLSIFWVKRLNLRKDDLRAAVEQSAHPSMTADAPGKSGSDYHIIVGESSHAGGMCAHMVLLADGLVEASQKVHVWLPNATELT